MYQETRKVITMYGGLYPRSNVEPLYRERKEVVGLQVQKTVNGGRQNLELYTLRSTEAIIAAIAEVKLKKVIKQAREKKTTSDQMERKNSSRTVFARNRKWN